MALTRRGPRDTQGDEACVSWADHFDCHSTRYRKQEPGVQQLKRVSINALVLPLFKEETVGFVCVCDWFVEIDDMCMRDGLPRSGNGAGIFADGLKQAVDSGLGNLDKPGIITQD